MLVAGSVGSSFILMHGHIIRTVRYVYQDMSDRSSEKTEVKYMQTWEERILLKQEGGKEMLEKLIKKKLEKNLSVEQIAEMLEIDILKVENIIKEIHNEK